MPGFALQVVVEIEIFLLDLATNGELMKRVWHTILIGEVDNFWVLRSELEDFAQLLNRVHLFLLWLFLSLLRCCLRLILLFLLCLY